METVDNFAVRAEAWLHDNAVHAPRNYGAIVPPELAGAARAWQRRLHDGGSPASGGRSRRGAAG